MLEPDGSYSVPLPGDSGEMQMISLIGSAAAPGHTHAHLAGLTHQLVYAGRSRFTAMCCGFAGLSCTSVCKIFTLDA